MLKKINGIFRLKGIFDFSHLHFDIVKVQSDGSGMEKKKIKIVTLKFAELFQWLFFFNDSPVIRQVILQAAESENAAHLWFCEQRRRQRGEYVSDAP